MALDYTLPLQVKAADPNLMLSNASQYADYFTKMKTDGELSRIYKESQGDLNKMLELGQQSSMARWVMPQLQAQRASQEKATLEKQKALADIGNTQAQALERSANAGNTVNKTANSQLDSARRAVFAGAQNGNPQYIKMGLNEALAAGAIDQPTFEQFNSQLEGLGNDPVKISEWAKNAVLAGSQNPASFLFQTADNAANNAQSDINNQRTTQASIYSTNVNAETADKNREQSNAHFQQQQYFQQNKPQQFITGADGYQYAVFADGTGMRILGQDGQPIQAMNKSGTANNAKIADIQADKDQATQLIQNLEKAKALSNQGLYDGAFSNFRANLMGNFGGTEESKRTQQYNNIVTQNALSSLKAIFGGSPTEGERALLLKIQASSEYPQQVREQILDEAITAARAKLDSYDNQVRILQGGGASNTTQQWQGVPYRSPDGGSTTPSLDPKIMSQMP